VGATFQVGDRVMLRTRPEWGQGTIEQARPAQHESRPAQRLVVNFARHKRVTLNSGVAPLQAADAAQHAPDHPEKSTNMSSTNASSDKGWLAQLEAAQTGGHELWDLPEATTDPFASLADRIQATLDTYRFSTEPKSLIDWAAVQTGLNDPLSKYTRHELEQAFPRFTRDRDKHLKDLIWQARKASPDTLKQVRRGIRHPKAQSAFDKATQR